MNVVLRPPCEGRSITALVFCGAGIESCWLGILALGNLRDHLPAFVGLFGAAFGFYLVACRLALTGRTAAPLWVMLAGAAMFRLTMLAAPPSLSDDLYRSVWEGRALLNGFSPYRFAPDAVELAHLRDDVWAGVNNKDIPSPYPPLAQAYAMATALFSPTSVFGPKLLSALIDTGIVLALLAWLRSGGLPDAALLLYAWAPLPVLVFAHSGHNDALMVLLLVAAMALGRRRYVGATLLALATLAKIAPIVVAPVLARRWGLGPTILFGGLCALGYAPLLLLGGGAPGSLLAFATTWSDNDSLFFVLRFVLWPLAGLDPRPAKAVSAVILLAGVMVLATHRRTRDWPAHRQALAALGLFLLLSSTVHAWYAVWLLPLLAYDLAFRNLQAPVRTALVYGWLPFSGLVALPYLTYADHVWQPWISIAEYGPLFAALVVAGVLWLRPAQPDDVLATSAPSSAPASVDGVGQ